MIVYRLESFSININELFAHLSTVNTGAYNSIEGEQDLVDIALHDDDFIGIDDSIVHPTPQQDTLIKSNRPVYLEDFVFVFSSMRQLRTWFFNKAGMQKLDDTKLARIGVYQVPEEYYVKGQFQSMAKDSEMTLIETRKCNCEL